jgi:hypothetical protein
MLRSEIKDARTGAVLKILEKPAERLAMASRKKPSCAFAEGKSRTIEC